MDDLNEPSDTNNEQVWAEEAERRFEELREGKASPIPSEGVFREVRSKLRRQDGSASPSSSSTKS